MELQVFRMRRTLFLLVFLGALVSAFPVLSVAAEPIPRILRQNLTLKYEYRHFTLNLNAESNLDFFVSGSVDQIQNPVLGRQRTPFFCSENPSISPSDDVPVSGWTINRDRLKAFLRDDIAPKLNHPGSNVTIGRDANGQITFDGYGESQTELDIEASADLIITAAQEGIDKVTLAVKKIPPLVTVTDPELKKMGINELVSVGWSIFDGSPHNRRVNIDVGRSRFTGVLIPQGAEFSFNHHLGPVNGSTGYLKELVIVGPKTIPEYGGGLCQVSSTTYRGAMLAGLPITERRNHSYAVRYYFPQGSDATIYPGSADLKFKNDTPGALLIQTRIVGDELFFHYYGTRDERRVYTLGPYLTNARGVPAPRYTTSTALPPGATQELSGIHPGIDATWFRVVENEKSEPAWQTFFSRYQARGLWIVRGATPEEAATSVSAPGNQPAETPPDWIGENT